MYLACLRDDPISWVTWLLCVNSKNASSYSMHYIWFQSHQVNAAKSFFVPQIVQRMFLLKTNSSVTLPIHKFSHVWVIFIPSNQIWGRVTWIYLVCLVAMFYLIHQLFMDLRCIFSIHDMVIIMDLQGIGLQPWFSWISQLPVLCQIWAHLSLPLSKIDILQTISPITSF